MLSVIKNLAGLAVLIWLGYFLYENWYMFEATQEVSWSHLSILTSCVIATWLVNSQQVYILLRAQGVHVGRMENLLVQTMAILGNYLPMRMGTIMRFHYFKAVHGIEYMKFGGIVSVRVLFITFVAGFLGALTLLIWFDLSDLQDYVIVLIFISMCIAPVILYFFRPKVRVKNKVLVKIIGLFSQALTTVRENHRLSLLVILLLLVQFLILSVRLYVSFDAMGKSISPVAFLVLAPTATLLSFITITPGNVGLREWVIGVLSAMMAYDFDIAMFAGLLDRVVLMVCTFIFGSISSVYVWMKIHRS